MPHRRDVLALGAAAGVFAGAGSLRALAAPDRPPIPNLVTRLFNIKPDAPQETTDAIIATLKDLARSPGIDGLLVGRNFIPTPFPTRFEWISMVQFAAGADGAAIEPFTRARDALSSYCRNEVECDLAASLPSRFADASGVKVRHTVMFDFKPDAPPDARRRNVEAIRAMGKLPMVQSYLVARNATTAPGPIQMEWQVIGDFASVDDYTAYSRAPVHLAIRDDFKAHTSRVAFLDVEV
jgi:hypothetical protein